MPRERRQALPCVPPSLSHQMWPRRNSQIEWQNLPFDPISGRRRASSPGATPRRSPCGGRLPRLLTHHSPAPPSSARLPYEAHQSRMGLFRRKRLHEPSRELLFSHPPRGNWPASSYRGPLPPSLFSRDCVARGLSPRLEWRTVFYGCERSAGASGQPSVERLLAARKLVLFPLLRSNGRLCGFCRFRCSTE